MHVRDDWTVTSTTGVCLVWTKLTRVLVLFSGTSQFNARRLWDFWLLSAFRNGIWKSLSLTTPGLSLTVDIFLNH
jgi:hypothetical protein